MDWKIILGVEMMERTLDLYFFGHFYNLTLWPQGSLSEEEAYMMHLCGIKNVIMCYIINFKLQLLNNFAIVIM